jgi:3-methyl-2-oxobutanoate hydroxymethyltransferase
MLSEAPYSGGDQHPGKISPSELGRMKRRGDRIVAVTAYDAPSGRLADLGGMDCVLVGDSAAMTVFGRESTVSATMDEMLMLARAVVRGARRALVIGDMPFGSYQVSDHDAVTNAIRFVKDAGTDAVKLEGAGSSISRVAAIVAAGIPVVGHIGLTPQTATMLGGYKTQGRTAEQARRLCDDALALEHAGCCAIVLEAMPDSVARSITNAARIPTIGIGAGASCDGQILVWHDLLNVTQGHVARFVKQYGAVGEVILEALERYATDVRTSRFPEPHHTYSMPVSERERFEAHRAGPSNDLSESAIPSIDPIFSDA